MTDSERMRRRPHGRSLVRPVGALAAALLLLPVAAGGSSAATGDFRDGNDSRTIDIRRVHVSYGDWLRVRVKYDGPLVVGQTYGLWIDTVRRNPGPEFYTGYSPWSEVGELKRVSGFGDITKTYTRCSKIDGGVNEARARIGFDIGGSCLRSPHRVRVSVEFLRPNGHAADWAPAARRFYPWVSRY